MDIARMMVVVLCRYSDRAWERSDRREYSDWQGTVKVNGRTLD
jgi:hypothetical protein